MDKNIDPSKPIHPLRRSFPVPGCFTDQWTPDDWSRWAAAHGVDEPLVMKTRHLGTWAAVGRNAAGELLYRRES